MPSAAAAALQVWTSSSGGASWTQVSAAAPFAPRDSLSWAFNKGVHVIYGGFQSGGSGAFYGDVWASTDDGASWLLLASKTIAGAYSNTAIIFDQYGFLYMFGGQVGSSGSAGTAWSSVEARSTVPINSPAQALQLAALVPSSPSSTGVARNAAATTPAAYGFTAGLLLAAAALLHIVL
jgi:hypothetical protein